MSNTEAAIPREQAQQETPALPFNLEVTVRPIEPKGNLIGFASINFGGVVVDDFRVFDGEKGMFVANPSKTDSSSRSGFRSTARVVDPDLQTQINVAVRDAYIKEVEKLQARAAAVRFTPEKPRIREQLAEGAEKAAKDNIEQPTPENGKAAKSTER